MPPISLPAVSGLAKQIPLRASAIGNNALHGALNTAVTVERIFPSALKSSKAAFHIVKDSEIFQQIPPTITIVTNSAGDTIHPDVRLPKIDIPKIDLPKIDLPKIDLPKIDLPKIDLPTGILTGISQQFVAALQFIRYHFTDTVAFFRNFAEGSITVVAEALKSGIVFVKGHLGAISLIVGGILLMLNPLVLLGFGALGPIAGSFAAFWQSIIGNVAAGSLFAILQSLGMVYEGVIPLIGGFLTWVGGLLQLLGSGVGI